MHSEIVKIKNAVAAVSAVVYKNKMKDSLSGREVIIEFFPVGNFVKVSAMDARTLTEISIQGPKSAGEEMLKRNALKRLEYVLKKKGLI